MPHASHSRILLLRCFVSASALALLAACGGGSGADPVSSRPPPSPTPTPTPSPTPTPTPTPPPTNFDTREYRDSDGPEFHNAITAWQDGITGQGSIIAIVDTGIDSDSPEFAGRIHPDSADVAGSRGIDGVDDHGTNVAMVAAAARDDTGILGIAFDAQVLAIRADEPGSCSADTPQDPSLNCLFNDRDIAAGVDLAVTSGAQVINLSLGGGGASQVLLDAVARASSAGVVIVVSAGNAGDGSDPDIDPDQPDPFATSLVQAGNGNVIIVGSIDANGLISDFSNRAGTSAGSYITARGERICCAYLDGELFVETINGQQFVTVFSGTSFSAPQVAGAVALLAQAFPNLTGAEIVEILLDSAADAGAAGTDAVFGRGILDIARALQPSGTTTLAGQHTAVALNDRIAIGSPAMGDALAGQGVQTIITDKYDRAYSIDLSAGLAGSSVVPRLAGAIQTGSRSINVQGRDLAMAFTVGDRPAAGQLGLVAPLGLTAEDVGRARVLAARVAARVAPNTQLGLAFAQGAEGLVAQLQGQHVPPFRVAPGARGDSGFFEANDAAMAIRHQMGGWGVTVHARSGGTRLAYTPRLDEVLQNRNERYPMQAYGISVDRNLGAVAGTLGITWMREEKSVLGAWLHPALDQGGADSFFLDTSARWALDQDWQLSGELRLGMTKPARGQVIASGSQLYSQAWAIDLVRRKVFAGGDTLGLRISQPLRVESGGLNLNLPATYDYATESAGFAIQRLSLTPQGREMLSEISWRGPALGGWAGASLFYRHEPGHYADSTGDVGAMVSFSADF